MVTTRRGRSLTWMISPRRTETASNLHADLLHTQILHQSTPLLPHQPLLNKISRTDPDHTQTSCFPLTPFSASSHPLFQPLTPQLNRTMHLPGSPSGSLRPSPNAGSCGLLGPHRR
ncbi:hypothetical protein Zmor_014356 [Zophobas morio]|uniref:Uncharacterized protein n=1 Tax=Zophobas morio TaxID=2755281 RepID=A0AA38IHK9_9CUCU|nr:hypothetical protein Zmor_014356 [Zophobas morio]